MKIGTINKFSLIDYPGKLAAVIGTQGCNMGCFWCHNHYLIPYDCLPSTRSITEDDLFQFLHARINFLDAVVISGGEPTLHHDLAALCEKIKALGYYVKLDTNGSNPVMLKELIDRDLLDYIAMDIKTSAEQYDRLFREKITMDDISASVEILRSGAKPYEFRTTCVAPFICRDNIDDVGGMITGAKLYYLQKCTDPENAHPKSGYRALDATEMTELKFKAAPYVETCEIR